MKRSLKYLSTTALLLLIVAAPVQAQDDLDVLVYTGKHKKADQYCKQQKDENQKIECWKNLAEIYERYNYPDKALECYEKAGLYMNVGNLYLKKDNPEKAELYFTKSKDSTAGYNSIGYHFLQKKNYEKAVEYFSKSVSVEEAYFKIAQSIAREASKYAGRYSGKDFEDAIVYYKKAGKAEEGYLIIARKLMEKDFYTAGREIDFATDFDETIDFYKKAGKTDEGYADISAEFDSDRNTSSELRKISFFTKAEKHYISVGNNPELLKKYRLKLAELYLKHIPVIEFDNKIEGFLPDGKSVIIWPNIVDIETKKIVKTFKGDTGKIETVEISDDGKYIATLHTITKGNKYFNSIKIWDAETFECLRTFKDTRGHKLKISPYNRYLVHIGEFTHNMFTVLDFNTGKTVRSVKTPYKHNIFNSFSADGKKIYYSNTEGACKMLDIESGKSESVNDMPYKINAVSANYKYALTGTPTNFELYNLESRKKIRSLMSDSWAARYKVYATISPDNKYAITFARGNMIISETETGECIRFIKDISTGKGTPRLQISPDNRYFSVGKKMFPITVNYSIVEKYLSEAGMSKAELNDSIGEYLFKTGNYKQAADYLIKANGDKNKVYTELSEKFYRKLEPSQALAYAGKTGKSREKVKEFADSSFGKGFYESAVVYYEYLNDTVNLKKSYAGLGRTFLVRHGFKLAKKYYEKADEADTVRYLANLIEYDKLVDYSKVSVNEIERFLERNSLGIDFLKRSLGIYFKNSSKLAQLALLDVKTGREVNKKLFDKKSRKLIITQEAIEYLEAVNKESNASDSR